MFKAKASNRFPDAEWTGGGAIHASIALSGVVPVPFDNKELLLASMYKHDWPAYMQRIINKNCPGMDWILSEEEFKNLVMVDYSRMLNGLGSLETKNKLKNPSTGNVFHRLIIIDDKWVGGVRVWIENYGAQMTNIGFRFRMEDQSEEQASTRDKVRIKLIEIEDQVMTLKENINTSLENPKVAEKLMVVENYLPKQYQYNDEVGTASGYGQGISDPDFEDSSYPEED